jgi:hypothetical protein
MDKALVYGTRDSGFERTPTESRVSLFFSLPTRSRVSLFLVIPLLHIARFIVFQSSHAESRFIVFSHPTPAYLVFHCFYITGDSGFS